MKKTIRCFARAGKWPGRGASGMPAVQAGGHRQPSIEPQPARRGRGRRGAAQELPAVQSVQACDVLMDGESSDQSRRSDPIGNQST